MLQIDSEFKSLIPKLSVDEYALLEEGILSEGCRDALVVWNDTIIDGHNRYEICQKHGLPFDTMPMGFESSDDAKIWIINNQLGRRNLPLIDRGILELEKNTINNDIRKRAKDNQGTRTDILPILAKSIDPIDTREEIAKRAGVSHGTLDKIEKIKEQSSPEIIQSIRDGDLTINKAYNYLKREEIKEQAKTIEQPKGKYRIIYADPPWQYSDKRDGNFTGAEDHYKTMSIEELCNLPIKDITQENAVLFLWVTSPLLAECFAVIDAWGFKYKASYIWDKIRGFVGHYNNVRHELLLICIKGSCMPDVTSKFDSIQGITKSPNHSEKPEYFRQIIDESYTYGNRIELFARKKSDKWDVWGNECG
jgi:N6-adenosine-specific RNA methylase IME4